MAEERFHIAEWYGLPFHELDEATRVRLANHKSTGSAMAKEKLRRLRNLESKASDGTLTPIDSQRLEALRKERDLKVASQLPCPFRHGEPDAVCTKKGGVCSLRLYEPQANTAVPVEGPRGRLRALCPWRFHQSGKIVEEIGLRLLKDPTPLKVGEVGFLQSTGSLDSEPGEDVGRIDMILVNSRRTFAQGLDWVAVEIQAVYFSGPNMGDEFTSIERSGGKLSMPKGKRRPDYRSSGVKRLMPQLLTKVPTLSRWGKKMVIVVDVPFFDSLGSMETVSDVSNCDIVWILVDFRKPDGSDKFELFIAEEVYTTLDAARIGLTGGVPVSLPEFESRIMAKVAKNGLA